MTAGVVPDRVLIVTCGMTGITNVCLEAARRVEAGGGECLVAGPAGARSAFEANGHRFVALVDDDDAHAEYRRVMRRPRPAALRSVWASRRSVNDLAEVRKIFDDWQPNVAAIDAEMHLAMVAASAASIPFVVLQAWCSVLRDLDTPPMHTDLDVAEDRRGRFRVRSAWMRLFVQRAASDVRAQLNPIGGIKRWLAPSRYRTTDARVIRRSIRRHGHRPRHVASRWHWLEPMVRTDAVRLNCVPQAFDLDRTPAALERYVGPMVRRDRTDTATTDRDRRTWMRALEHRRTSTGLIYVSLGTRFEDQVAVVERVLRACAHRSETVVVGLGGAASSEAIDAPVNAFVLDYAPQSRVLGDADLAVIHAGIGTITECMMHEVPMVVHRYGTVDQPGCAMRVEWAGLGARVDLATVSANQLTRIIDDVRDDPAVRRRLSAMRATIDEDEAAHSFERALVEVAHP